MKNIADLLIDSIIEKQSCAVVGLDPKIQQIPEFIREECKDYYGNSLKAVARAFAKFNKFIINEVYDIVPAVKPQIAFYEEYGYEGIRAFEETINYAKSKGLLVIIDAKRNDIGSTAEAYSCAHIGRAELINGSLPVFDADFVTVNPYLGIDGVKPFINDCKNYNKGIFILDKTSNKSSGELQDKKIENEGLVYELVAEKINNWGGELIGEYGYSCIGPVVGATYPDQAKILRNKMPYSYFLVPGYGAQGGTAEDVKPCFNSDGLGAVVNSSGGIIFAYLNEKYSGIFSPENFDKASRQAVNNMNEDINNTLEKNNKKYW
ncbi:orotidine-5'-phosphate decarboxylase [archaeon CG07_land_8_20_14_0_80_38_8]|nr:MAG: orotidine-5'-phosphate decarboxylase [archaeon CG07_land_8_20_14_0_80_38_8]PIU88532.1 MAG: orotidine-5'-phosphate decarboxylase [archaeon CG06_land_8_20_14_3_00_37_11]